MKRFRLHLDMQFKMSLARSSALLEVGTAVIWLEVTSVCICVCCVLFCFSLSLEVSEVLCEIQFDFFFFFFPDVLRIINPEELKRS